MVISIMVFLFILSRVINFNEKKSSFEIDKNIFDKKIKFCFLTIFSYSIILTSIMIMSEGSDYSVPIKYFMADTASDRYFAPINQ